MKTLGLFGPLGGTEILIIFLIIPLLFAGLAFLNGKIAQWKGYPFWAGAISAFAHVFGTILFLLLPFNKVKNRQQRVKTTNGKNACM